MFDVAIVGSGPAGASCAAFCANAGLRTLVLERELFPREKVCGDCLNPGCWPILERLGVVERLAELPHARLSKVDFVDAAGRVLTYALSAHGRGVVAIKRSEFDQLLLTRAAALGAVV